MKVSLGTEENESCGVIVGGGDGDGGGGGGVERKRKEEEEEKRENVKVHWLERAGSGDNVPLNFKN